MKNDMLERIYLAGIIPVVVLDNSTDAVPLAKSLVKTGIHVAEITFRTPAAKASIESISKEVPDILVGAGTVISVKNAQDAVAAGAKFIVTPGFDETVVKWCIENEVTIIPGTATATEIQAAMKLGIDTVKIFPAELLGGLKYIKSLSDVFRGMKFIPSGGINADNLCSYLDVPAISAVCGSWLCPSSLIKEEKWHEIEALCQQAVLTMHSFSLLHIGLNSLNADEAKKNANDFADMFGLLVVEYPGAYYVGTLMEVVKKTFLGEHGHIALNCNYIDRAVDYFEKRGYTFRDRPKVINHNLMAIYFEKMIGGFAIHLRHRL
jgi:2-dehydro-3-deoxyphosphogluconate aldolase/(4S)-4-hydroxy-2-oxoglutarate aldolase